MKTPLVIVAAILLQGCAGVLDRMGPNEEFTSAQRDAYTAYAQNQPKLFDMHGSWACKETDADRHARDQFLVSRDTQLDRLMGALERGCTDCAVELARTLEPMFTNPPNFGCGMTLFNPTFSLPEIQEGTHLATVARDLGAGVLSTLTGLAPWTMATIVGTYGLKAAGETNINGDGNSVTTDQNIANTNAPNIDKRYGDIDRSDNSLRTDESVRTNQPDNRRDNSVRTDNSATAPPTVVTVEPSYPPTTPEVIE